MVTVAGGTGKWATKVILYVRDNPSIIAEAVTLTAAAAVFVADWLDNTQSNSVATATLGILALLAFTSLVERLSRLDRIYRSTLRLQRELGTGDFADTIVRRIATLDASAANCARADIVDVWPRLSSVDHASNFASACDLRILQTWTGQLASFDQALLQAATRGCRIRILLLDPESVLATYRSRDLAKKEDYGRAVIMSDLGDMAVILAKCHGGSMEVRVYDAMNSISMYAFDEPGPDDHPPHRTRIFGPFWQNVFALESPQIQVEGDRSILAQRADEHFDTLWHHVRTKRLCPDAEGAVTFAQVLEQR